MPESHPMITSFAAGEWSPSMEGRTDLQNYRQACRLMENFICLPQGPAITRPGFRFINEIKSSASKARLLSFIHSNQQAYIVEAGNLYFRFYMNQARILDGGTPPAPYEVVSPYTAAQLPAVQMDQSADVAFLCHGSHPVQQLSRTGHAAWSLAAVDFGDGPYLDENTDGLIHLIPSAVTGAGTTVTAQYMYGTADLTTWAGTPGADTAALTVASSKAGFRFKITSAGTLSKFKMHGGGSVANPNLATARLYADTAGSPSGSPLATSIDTQDMVAVADKEWNFAGYALTANVYYWMVIACVTPDNGITLSTVAGYAAYGSGTAATIAGITDNLGAEWKVVLTYQPTGAASVFQAGHVGSTWRIAHDGQTALSAMGAVGVVSTAIKILGKFVVDITVTTAWIGRIALKRSTNQVTWRTVATFSGSTRQEFTETRAGVYYKLECTEFSAGSATAAIVQVEHWGAFTVTGYTSPSQVTATVLSDLGAATASPQWREPAWSAVRGYPKALCWQDDRLCFGFTDFQPLTQWMSDPGDYTNFSPDSGALTLTHTKIKSAIQWMKGLKAFVVGTLGEEANLSTRKAEPMTGTNPPFVDIESSYGSQIDTVPVAAGPALVFIQAGGRQVRQFLYNFSLDSYVADDLTFLADHVGVGGIAELAYQQTPYSLLWGRTADGNLICATYARIGEDISKGWHRHPMDGVVESIATIPSSFGDSDARCELWTIIARTIGGVTKRYIEVLADNYAVVDQEDYFCVDSGLTYDGTVVSTVSGLAHLEGKTVAIFADGAFQAEQVVAGGTVALDPPALVAHVGLPFTCKLKPQRLEAGASDGTAQGRVKEVASITLRLRNSLGGKIGPDENNLIDIPEYIPSQAVAGITPPIFTGDTEPIPWPGDANTDESILIVQDRPCPMTVLAIMPDMVTND